MIHFGHGEALQLRLKPNLRLSSACLAAASRGDEPVVDVPLLTLGECAKLQIPHKPTAHLLLGLQNVSFVRKTSPGVSEAFSVAWPALCPTGHIFTLKADESEETEQRLHKTGFSCLGHLRWWPPHQAGPGCVARARKIEEIRKLGKLF